MNTLDPRITLLTLGVADLAKSIAFYQRLFGLAPRPDTDGVAFFELRSTWLALYPVENLSRDAGIEAPPIRPGGYSLAHNVRTREEVDAALLLAADAGAQIVRPGHDVFWGGYVGYFTDPDGHLWEIAWNPHFEIEANAES